MASGDGVVVRAGHRLPLVLRRDQPSHVPYRSPHPDGAAHRRLATKTHSLPGRSGASRTSSTANPAAASESSTSARSRNRNVESDVSTAPSDENTYVPRNVTNGSSTLTSSLQHSTVPPPGTGCT